MSIRPSLPLAGLLLAVALPLSAAQPGAAKGAPLSGCAAKQAAIEAKLETARSFANEGQVAGLEKALSEVREHCTEAGLLRENKQKVIDSEREVSEREKDLRKAMGKGDPEKIEKRKAKLAEARAELEEAKKAWNRPRRSRTPGAALRPTPRTSHVGRITSTALSAIRAAAGHQMPPTTAATADERWRASALRLAPCARAMLGLRARGISCGRLRRRPPPRRSPCARHPGSAWPGGCCPGDGSSRR